MRELSITQKKHKQPNSKAQTNPGSVASYDTRPGNEVAYSTTAPEPTRAKFTLDLLTYLIW